MRCPERRMPIYSGKNRLSMNAFSGFGDHLDCERGPDRGFEAAYVRSKVFCEGDGFRGERKLPANFVLNPERVLNVEKEAHGKPPRIQVIAAAGAWTLILVN